MKIFGSIHLFVLIWIGVAVLWSLRLAYRRRGAAADDSIRLILTIAGWVLILAGILGTAIQGFIFAGPLSWIVILAIIMMAVGRYRGAENRTLLWCLAAAAERGIPLEQAARAYSMERSDELGIRAARLASLLEGGTPLSLALADARVRLPLDALVAVRVGIETGDLGQALSTVGKHDDDADTLLRSIFEKVFYLGVVANVLLIILTFIMLKIVPVYAKMFEEFELDLPAMTQLLVYLADRFINYWFFLFPLIMWLPMFLVVGMLHYIGWLPRNLPLINWFALRLDGGLVLRCLALSVKQQRPLTEMIWLLARLYPKSSVRKRLLRAGHDLNNGQHWCTALRQAKLIRSSDLAILTAAERSGNLEWALEEMADSSIRRLAYRLRLALNVLFPAVLFVFGLFIAFVVISLFMPLVSLIQGLS
ncbi:MAG: type II secretion system F family protein [Planctomycetaceae bacterium]|nr:type II secretion system F family protein [Planctomycetales bacterium]MCB9922872.1 type II secretion system F family protein [Planctomycetaceae bacterium]